MTVLDNIMREAANVSSVEQSISGFFEGLARHLRDGMRHGNIELVKKHVFDLANELEEKAAQLGEAMRSRTSLEHHAEEEPEPEPEEEPTGDTAAPAVVQTSEQPRNEHGQFTSSTGNVTSGGSTDAPLDATPVSPATTDGGNEPGSAGLDDGSGTPSPTSGGDTE